MCNVSCAMCLVQCVLCLVQCVMCSLQLGKHRHANDTGYAQLPRLPTREHVTCFSLQETHEQGQHAVPSAEKDAAEQERRERVAGRLRRTLLGLGFFCIKLPRGGALTLRSSYSAPASAVSWVNCANENLKLRLLKPLKRMASGILLAAFGSHPL